MGEVRFPEISTPILEKVCEYCYYKLRYANACVQMRCVLHAHLLLRVNVSLGLRWVACTCNTCVACYAFGFTRAYELACIALLLSFAAADACKCLCSGCRMPLAAAGCDHQMSCCCNECPGGHATG